ncbi:MAG: spore coat protein SA, partial [Candidatus Latescibacterota bacterium]
AVWRTFGGKKREIHSEFELRRFCYVDGVADLLTTPDVDVDVVQVHNRPQFLPYLKKKLPQVKIILYLHNEANYDDKRVQEGIRLSDRIVFVSAYLANQYATAFPGCSKKSVVIHNSVDTAFWHPKNKTHRKTLEIRNRYHLPMGATVLYVGRIVHEKGLHCLIDAMRVVRKCIPHARLVVVGSPLFGAIDDDAYTRRIKKRARILGNGVVFTGFVGAKRLRYYYAAADVAVVPSLWEEPFGKVVIESMAMGVPVIGSCRGGIPEIITQGRGGVLVDDPEDVQVLAGQILGVLENKNRRIKMGAEGRKVVGSRFSPDLRHHKLMEVYRDVV